LNRYRKVLIALTDSSHARHACGQGLALAASMGAKVVAVSVVPLYEGNMNRLYVQDMREQLEAPHRKALEEAKEKAEAIKVPCRVELLEGNPFETIADIAEAVEADAIVLGSKQRQRFERSIMGSTAIRVIGYSRSDVLVIPEGKEVNFSRILLATDGSRDCENAISKALQLAVEYGSELRAVSIIDIPADYVIWEEVMKECIDKARGNVDAVVEKGEEVGVKVQVGIRQADAVEGVLREAEEWNASLIVLGTHGHTGLKRLLLGSVAAGVLSGNSFPVLVCP